MRFVGCPYRWGGTNPLTGFDCSGLVRHLLHCSGVATDNPGNASSLRHQFSHLGEVEPTLGALVFYADSAGNTDHVALALNAYQHIEAAGGDHSTLDLQRAIEQNAFVRVTPIRANHVSILLPPYPFPLS